MIIDISFVSRDAKNEEQFDMKKDTPCLQKNEDLQRKKLLSRLNFDLGGSSGP